jgi:uncharacterized OB-fold protein
MEMSETEQKLPQRIPVLSKRLKLSEDGNEGVLLGMKCRSCGEQFFGAPRFCLKCASGDLQPVELSKKGTLYSYTTVWAPSPGWEGAVPYIIGQVELPEGPRINAEIVDCSKDIIKIGMTMELALRVGGKDENGNEIVVYKWKPTPG